MMSFERHLPAPVRLLQLFLRSSLLSSLVSSLLSSLVSSLLSLMWWRPV
jgi:hypothetical protein